MHKGGCLSHMKYNSNVPSSYMYGLQCRDCDFDVCLQCILGKETVREVYEDVEVWGEMLE